MVVNTVFALNDVLGHKDANWVMASIANSVSFTYNADGTINVITETVDSSTITTTFAYNADGTVNTLTEVRATDGITITTTFTYNANKTVASIARTVV